MEEGQAMGELVKAGGTFTVLENDLEEFNQLILFKLALNYPVTFELIKGTAPQELTAKSKRIRTLDQGEYVAFIPEILYEGGLDIPVQSGGMELLQIKNGQAHVLQRNNAAESAFKSFFMELHPAFRQQEALPYFYLPKDTLRTELWFARTIYNLNDPDVTFTGLENLTGIDFHIQLPDIAVNVQEEKGWFDIGVSVTFGEVELSPEEIQSPKY